MEIEIVRQFFVKLADIKSNLNRIIGSGVDSCVRRKMTKQNATRDV
jgi:hypothetical protein